MRRAFETRIGPTELVADGFGGLNLQAADAEMLTSRRACGGARV
jgi:hypothetical protein